MAKLVNEFTWSVSRDQLFRQCARAYYYTYYGSWGGWEADADPVTRLLYILKNIRTLEMWAGSIVHETIAEALVRYSRKRTPIQAGEQLARARQRLRAGWLEAVNREWVRSPKKTNLFDLYYGNGRSLPKADTDRVLTRVNTCLEAFAASEILREILGVPYLSWKPVDQLDSFMMDDLKVWCAIDFAFVDPAGTLRIVDWKTGSEKPDSLRIQLACYAFFAQAKWFAAPDRIRAAGVFLQENARYQEYPLTPDLLVDARDAILTSAAAMREMLSDPAANVPRPENEFAFCEQDYACRRCCFRQVCPKTAGSAAGSPLT